MRSELPEERDRDVADGVMLLTTLCVAVATWSSLANNSTAPWWEIHVGLIFLFALAGLTRHAGWAGAIRFLMGIWTISTPLLLGLTVGTSALWICLTTGVVLTALSVPEVISEKSRDLVGRFGGGGRVINPTLMQM